MRTWCYLVAAILAAHAGAALAGGYLCVTGPVPLRFQPPTAPTDGVPANAKPEARASDDGTQPCPTNTYDDAATSETATVTATSPCTETNTAPAIVVETESSATAPSPGQLTEQPPLTSQILAEIFRHTAETSTNQFTTTVLTSGFLPPQPAPSRSSSATYTDH